MQTVLQHSSYGFPDPLLSGVLLEIRSTSPPTPGFEIRCPDKAENSNSIAQDRSNSWNQNPQISCTADLQPNSMMTDFSVGNSNSQRRPGRLDHPLCTYDYKGLQINVVLGDFAIKSTMTITCKVASTLRILSSEVEL